MNKIERNEMIIKLTKENKTNAEIIKELKMSGVDISERTIRRVLSENDSSRKFSITSGADINGQNGFYITEEMWESLQDKIDSLLDTIDIQSAKIQSLEADVIKASKVHCNELKSDKKYIVKRLSTREFIAYADEDELGRYIKAFGGKIPISTIDNSINERSNWICRMDDVLVEYTTENIIDNVDYKSKLLQNKHDSLEQALNKMMDLQ